MQQQKDIKVARGLEQADLVIKNANIVNVLTEEIYKGDIAINNENVSCKFCKYKDICYKKEQDIIYLKEYCKKNDIAIDSFYEEVTIELDKYI